jgi:hypothetical protein
MLKFYVTNDRTYACQFTPIQFVWVDCGDNVIKSATGDTAFISTKVFDSEWDGESNDPIFDLTNTHCAGSYCHLGGACEYCDTVGRSWWPERAISFWNGGIKIHCPAPWCPRGDLNMNGIPNQVSDAELYVDYFMYGDSVFTIAYEGQVSASDVNNDGLTLTVADLTYMLRVIYGDALPYPQLAPYGDSLSLTFSDSSFNIESSAAVGAVWAIFLVEDDYHLINTTGMEILSYNDDGELRVLLYSGLQDPSKLIPAGAHTLFTLSGDVALVSVQASDYDGNMMVVSGQPAGAFRRID